ncbi:MAG: Rrf2 family transcriptional regulator [bacterium]|nr:Rrf2 family transcriptional regulator [bacterium]
MRLSTKTRYAVRALIDLALHYKGKPVLIKDIAERQNVSTRYLENIFTVLRAGGILSSSRGLGGGFSLARDPGKIDLLRIVEMLEGSVLLVNCLEAPKECSSAGKCVTQEVWRNLNRTIRENLVHVTLKDLIQKQKKFFRKMK